jgi:hypothetical protein
VPFSLSGPDVAANTIPPVAAGDDASASLADVASDAGAVVEVVVEGIDVVVDDEVAVAVEPPLSGVSVLVAASPASATVSEAAADVDPVGPVTAAALWTAVRSGTSTTSRFSMESL